MSSSTSTGRLEMADAMGIRADRAPLRRKRTARAFLQFGCIMVSLFMIVPIYLIASASFSSRQALNGFPLAFWPKGFTLETISAFVVDLHVVPALLNSLIVGIYTMVLSLLFGLPAAYALARYAFRGKDPYQLFLLFTRAMPIVVLSIPLAQIFLHTGLYDTNYAVTLLHTALALPTTVLITSSVLVSIPRDLEEAAAVFGCTPLQSFLRVVIPLALPGIAAASIFTFVTSWNEVLGAAVLTFDNRTLPAQVLTSLNESSLQDRFAAGFILVVPALIFIAVMRRYLIGMWGTTLR